MVRESQVEGDLKARIRQIICDVLQISPVAFVTENLRELESVDSINLVRVMARIEEHFDIEIEDELVFEVTTLDELVATVTQLVPSPTAS